MNAVKVDSARRIRLPVLTPGDYYEPEVQGRGQQITLRRMIESEMIHGALPRRQDLAEKTALERQITATDSQLDTLIYALYDLTDAEIKIVEKGRPGLPDRGRRTSVSEFVAVEADLIEGQGLEPEFPCG